MGNELKPDKSFPYIWLCGTVRWINDEFLTHRTDGPAVYHMFGSERWYHHGVMICAEHKIPIPCTLCNKNLDK